MLDFKHSTPPLSLFEVSWEVCNKVGGIHTVVASKSSLLVKQLGDNYITVGPWLMDDQCLHETFVDEEGHEDFVKSCRSMGVAVRVGRWQLPCRPLTILVGFSDLFEYKNEILARMWEEYRVDSLFGGWDYLEPVLFGHSCGRVIAHWWKQNLSAKSNGVVAHFHEWLTGSGLLYLKRQAPAIATLFTTHATILGRSLASSHQMPIHALGERSPEQAANELDIRAKHSLEHATIREADVFTTVSEITQAEAQLLHGRLAQPVTHNGMDLDYMDKISAYRSPKGDAKKLLLGLASCMCDRDLEHADCVAISGRYEFHNKGIDLFLDSLAILDKIPGPPILAYFLIPAGNTGIRPPVLERWEHYLQSKTFDFEGEQPLGVSTHNLVDHPSDPIAQRCQELGLNNQNRNRVIVVHIPQYIATDDPLFQCSYESLLSGFSLTCFPSFYEPWGYTPAESLAVGVPTITSDLAGIGQWALGQSLELEQGILVLRRNHRDNEESSELLAPVLAQSLTDTLSLIREDPQISERCRETVRRLNWSELIQAYHQGYELARSTAKQRIEQLIPSMLRDPQPHQYVQPQRSTRPILRSFEVHSDLPQSLQPLRELSKNLWWSWNPNAEGMFRKLDPDLWLRSGRDPFVLLEQIDPERLNKFSTDPTYLDQLDQVHVEFKAHIGNRNTDRFSPEGPIHAERPIVYLSAEYGLHPSLRIYSGGLGVLSGDHLKSCSDNQVPLIAIGLFYRQGYLRQAITSSGDQLALPCVNDPSRLPMSLLRDQDQSPVTLEIALPNRVLTIRVYSVEVGRIRLYLLDADQPENLADDRSLTHHLYPADRQTRLRQEIILGIGGGRLVRALNIDPAGFHLNEGHSAFVVFERLSQLIGEHNLTFDEARTVVRLSTTFTTHTPVPAGNDRFSEDLMRQHFAHAERWIGLHWEQFMALGQAKEGDTEFDMTWLALGFSNFVNGVSQKHAEVSRRMFHSRWPGLLESEVPIKAITNGVHLSTWTHPDLAALLDVTNRPVRGENFRQKAADIDLEALWSARQRSKIRLIQEVEYSLKRQLLARRTSPTDLENMLEGLTGDFLLIGFARRFASYKRANLLLHNPERLHALVSDPQRPIRIFYSGLAHPADGEGQSILRRTAALTHSKEFIGKIFLLEDYGIGLARDLVQGVDLWLNTPRRGMEASGTSGMKVACNGGLNLSILDGWWLEGWNKRNGWTIGYEDIHSDGEFQDELDAASIYRILEEEIIPEYFDRDGRKIPRRWLERVRNSMATLPHRFDSDRMVSEYVQHAYYPSAQNLHQLCSNHHSAARKIAESSQRYREQFSSLQFVSVETSGLHQLSIGTNVEIRAVLRIGHFPLDQLLVQAVIGEKLGEADLHDSQSVILTQQDTESNDFLVYFRGYYRVTRPGNYGLGVRVCLRTQDFPDLDLLELIRWG